MADEGDPWELCPACGAPIAPEAERCGSCRTPLSAPPVDEPGVPMVQDLVPVFSGAREPVLALHAALACEGFTTFIPDLNVRTMVDPFAIGGNCLGFDLLAARDQAPEIEAAIVRLHGQAAPAAAPASMRDTVLELARHARDWWHAQSPGLQTGMRAVLVSAVCIALVMFLASLAVLLETGSLRPG